jgi:adenylate cyclase
MRSEPGAPTSASLSEEERLEARLREVNRAALRIAGSLAALVGGVSMVGCLGAYAVTGQPQMRSAVWTAALGFLFGVALRAVAPLRQRGLAEALLLVGTVIPTMYFLLEDTAAPLGAASGLLGPVGYLYAFIVACSGLLLRPGLPVVSGLLAAAQLLGLYAWARTDIDAAQLDPALRFELSDPVGWVFRAGFIAAVGLATAGASHFAQRLLRELRDEQREVLSVTRLFGQFVSDEVRDKILMERGALRGERRELAVLFSDLRGFTAWSERTAPEEVVARLNRYFAAMVDAIEREGGVVDKFIGDAVMATFGGMGPLPDPAGSALRAALGMRRALASLNEAWAGEGVPPLSSGVGVDFGAVIQGPLGPERRREFTAIGDPVNTASRLESATKDAGRDVIVSAALVARLPAVHGFDLEPLGDLALKGRAAAVRAWALRG